MPNKIAQIVDHFIYLKGLEQDEVVYKRYLKDAKDLLALSGSVEKAQWNLEKMKEWADGRGLEWNIGTVIKRFFL